MLKKILEGNIIINEKNISWQEALEKSLKLLENKQYVTNHYLKTILKNVEDTGFYFIIAPEIALAHARPEDGVLKTGLALLKSSVKIPFGDHTDVQLVFALSSINNTDHVDILVELSELLQDTNKLNKILNSKAENEILNIISGDN